MKTIALLFCLLASCGHAQICDPNFVDMRPVPLGALGVSVYQAAGSSLLRIAEVTPGSPGAAAGLRTRDFIYGVSGERLPPAGRAHDEGIKGALSEIGYAIERAESTNGNLQIQILRPNEGTLTVSAALPVVTGLFRAEMAWSPSFPVGDRRMDAYYEKVCADIHIKVLEDSFFSTDPAASGASDYFGPLYGLILLAHPEWNATTGQRPYRNSINRIRDRSIAYLAARILLPVQPGDPGYVDHGYDNWHTTMHAMFLGEYRRKTSDPTVVNAVQRAAEVIANRIMDTRDHRMNHGGVALEYGYEASGDGLNIINAHAMLALGILRGAGADFTRPSGTSGRTIDQKYLGNWNRLKTRTYLYDGIDPELLIQDGNISYSSGTNSGRSGGCAGGWDANARTPCAAAGYEIYRAASGTAATADDLLKLGRIKAYTPRNWQKQHNNHGYSTTGTVFSQMVLPFLGERERRYFLENSRFLFTLGRGHDGTVLWVPGRNNLTFGDLVLGAENVRYLQPGIARAIASGNLPSFPAPAPASAYVRLKSHRSDWPQPDARRVKVIGLVQNLDLDMTDYQGNVVTSGIGVNWSKTSGPAATFSSASSLDTTVTFSAPGSYRLHLQASHGTFPVDEYYDFEVTTSTPPVDTSAAITQHPFSRFALPGGSVTFPLAVSGTGPFVYQWKRNGVNFGEPQTTPDLQLTNLSPITAGAFQCSIVHPGGRIESREAVLSFSGMWKLEAGGLKQEVWQNIPGNTVAELTGNPRYPACPDVTRSVSSGAGPRDYGENYGQRLSGWIVAPLTGRYGFYVRCNNACELWISEDQSRAKLKKVAELSSTTGSAGTMDFTAGQRYYLEILHKAGTGADFVEIVWQKPGDPTANASTPAMPGSALEYASFTPEPVSDGLVSHWKFDEIEGTTAIDSTAVGNDGRIIGATPTVGRTGSGRLFDGTDQIQCGNAGALCGLEPFTVAAWIRVDNGNSTDGVIIQQRAANGINGQYMLNVNGAGRLRFWCYGDSATQFDFTGSMRVNDGQWHHVAAARNATGGAFLYVDGVLDDSVSGTTVRMLDGDINIGIGADIRDNNKHFRGTIDEVRVYKRALTAAQAAAVMNLTPPAAGYQQAFTGLANGATTFPDGSVLATSVPGAARIDSNGQTNRLILTAAETLWTRTEYVLPQLRPGTYGFSASFRYVIIKPAAGPWADGLGFYLKPASEPVDIASNQVGGYAKGLGVEFITFSNPRHQIRVNNTVLPANYPVSPNVDAQGVNVRIEYRKPPGFPGSLTVLQNGVPVLTDVPVDYAPGPFDVFAFTARTGAYAQTTLIDDISITPLSLKPASNLAARHLSRSGDVTFTEVKWDSDPTGVYDLFVSTDLQNWSFSRSYTATDLTTGFTSVGSIASFPRYFFRVARQQSGP